MAQRLIYIDATNPVADALKSQIDLPKSASAAEIVQAVVMSGLWHKNVRIVFRVQIPKKYVQMVVEFSEGSADLELTIEALRVAALFIHSPLSGGKRLPLKKRNSLLIPHPPDVESSMEGVPTLVAAQRAFVLDRTPNVDGNDLRDDATGRLDAKKVAALFSVKPPSIAQAAGISPQALNANPLSPKAQRVLKLFERIARLRSYPQFRNPADLRKWFRQSLPLFSGHSAEDLFKAGKLDFVATKVDQMLTGDFGG